MNNTLLVKNILYAISIGVVVNVTLTTPALANVKTDTIIEDKASINIVQEQYLHLSEINLNDIKQIDNNIKLIDKNKKLSVEDVKTFNKNRILDKRCKIIQEDESKWQNDFKDKVVYNKGLNQDIDNSINNIEQDEFNDIVDDFKINKQETINKNNNSKYAVELNDDVFINKKNDIVEEKKENQRKCLIEMNDENFIDGIKYNIIKDVQKNQQKYKEKMNKKNNSHSINYKYANLTNDERNAIREDAVIKAREGNYNYALNILDNLYKSEKTDYKTINDYITILNWAGKYQEAIDVYEKNKYDGMPDYVLLNIASSYYRIMNLNKAEEILQPLVNKDDKEATILLSQIYIKMSRIKDANELYDELEKKYPNDVNIKIQKALSCSSVENWSLAAYEWKQILDAYDENTEKIIKKIDIVNNLSISYIKLARYDDAEKLLREYINNHMASGSMIGNYMTSLNMLAKSEQVPQIYDKYYSSYEETPIFVLRELADSYIRSKKYDLALDIYKYLYKQQDVNTEDRYRLAYYSCLNGDFDTGKNVYENILSMQKNSNDNFPARILREGNTLLKQGKYKAADVLYQELIKYDKRYHAIYVDDLVKESQYQTALHEAYLMAKDEEMHDTALESIVQISTKEEIRDYKTAEKLVNELHDKYKTEDRYAKAGGSFRNKKYGEVYAEVNNYSDYDDTSRTDINLMGEQYLENNFWIDYQIGKTYIKDENDGNTANLETKKLGLRYTSRKWNSLIAVNLFGLDSNDKTGLYVDTSFNPSDREIINFIYSSEPVYNANVINNYDGGLFSDNYSLRYNYIFNNRENSYIELRKSDFDDDNKRYGWEISHQYIINNEYDNDDGRSLTRTFTWSRDRYSNQDVVYNSPKLSEFIGADWRWSQHLSTSESLYKIFGIGWSRDYPEELVLSPYIGIEYNKAIDNNQYINAGIIYGLHTESWLGEGSWEYDNKQIYLSYYHMW